MAIILVVQKVEVIDGNQPEDNDFFLASQFWISGDMGNKRADLVGFINAMVYPYY